MLRSLAVLFEDFIISLVHTTQHSPACRLAFGRKVRDPRAQHLLRRHHEFPLRHPKRRQNIAWKDHRQIHCHPKPHGKMLPNLIMTRVQHCGRLKSELLVNPSSDNWNLKPLVPGPAQVPILRAAHQAVPVLAPAPALVGSLRRMPSAQRRRRRVPSVAHAPLGSKQGRPISLRRQRAPDLAHMTWEAVAPSRHVP